MNDGPPRREGEEPSADDGRHEEGAHWWLTLHYDLRLPPPGRWWDSIRTLLLFLLVVAAVMMLLALVYGVRLDKPVIFPVG